MAGEAEGRVLADVERILDDVGQAVLDEAAAEALGRETIAILEDVHALMVRVRDAQYAGEPVDPDDARRVRRVMEAIIGLREILGGV